MSSKNFLSCVRVHKDNENLVGGSSIGFFNPAIPTTIFSQSHNPDGLYRPIPIPIPIIQYCLGPFPKLKRAFSVGDDFLNQHWSVDVYGHRMLFLEVRAFEDDRFDQLYLFLFEIRRGSSSSCHRCFLLVRALTHCCNKCLRPDPHLL